MWGLGGAEAAGRDQGGAWSQLGYPWCWITQLTVLNFLATACHSLLQRTLSLMALVRRVENWACTLTPGLPGAWLMLFLSRAVGFLDQCGAQKSGKRQGLGMKSHPGFLLPLG